MSVGTDTQVETTPAETTPVAVGPVADAIAAGLIGGRLWFYANYHCNLECTYCLTESGPRVRRRILDPATMLDIARQARDLGFTGIGVTGGEPFMLPSLPDTVEALANIPKGTELTIDYQWSAYGAIKCLCGSEQCRGWVVALEELPKLLKSKNRKPQQPR